MIALPALMETKMQSLYYFVKKYTISFVSTKDLDLMCPVWTNHKTTQILTPIQTLSDKI
jgi:hypothetical protein